MAIILLAMFWQHGAVPVWQADWTAAATELEPVERINWAGQWAGEALRRAVDRSAALQQVSFFLDRRIDPDALISGDFPPSSLSALLEGMAQNQGFAVTTVGNIIYLGPPEKVRLLRTLDRLRTAEARKLNAPWAQGLLAKRTVQWPDLTSPRDLVLQVCREAQVSLTNADQIPHDLWAAGRLPDLPRVTQLTILLAGFDLSFDCEVQGALTLRPVRDDELWVQDYHLGAGTAGRVEELQQELSHVRLNVASDRLQVIGLVEDHEIVQRWLQFGGRPRRPSDQDRATEPRRDYVLRVVRQPLREVLQALESPPRLSARSD